MSSLVLDRLQGTPVENGKVENGTVGKEHNSGLQQTRTDLETQNSEHRTTVASVVDTPVGIFKESVDLIPEGKGRKGGGKGGWEVGRRKEGRWVVLVGGWVKSGLGGGDGEGEEDGERKCAEEMKLRGTREEGVPVCSVWVVVEGGGRWWWWKDKGDISPLSRDGGRGGGGEEGYGGLRRFTEDYGALRRVTEIYRGLQRERSKEGSKEGKNEGEREEHSGGFRRVVSFLLYPSTGAGGWVLGDGDLGGLWVGEDKDGDGDGEEEEEEDKDDDDEEEMGRGRRMRMGRWGDGKDGEMGGTREEVYMTPLILLAWWCSTSDAAIQARSLILIHEHISRVNCARCAVCGAWVVQGGGRWWWKVVQGGGRIREGDISPHTPSSKTYLRFPGDGGGGGGGGFTEDYGGLQSGRALGRVQEGPQRGAVQQRTGGVVQRTYASSTIDYRLHTTPHDPRSTPLGSERAQSLAFAFAFVFLFQTGTCFSISRLAVGAGARIPTLPLPSDVDCQLVVQVQVQV
ncbi:hypothetical protein F5879DRAFT_1055185 [Lentinula edodes]|nr:hypothetical protein F5879DRAFT_1055185 [Lentinula edodes]